MRLLLVWLLLIGVAAVLVQSETSFEVDDNGDEFEVKRFNIQSRQMNGGRSQCVVSRRRRSMPAAGGYGANEDEDQDEDERQEVEGLEVTRSTPPSGVDTVTSMADPNQNDDAVQFLDIGVGQKEDESPADSDENGDGDGDGDDMENEHDTSDQQVLFQTVPVKSQSQSNVGAVPVAVDGAVASSDGVVVVQAESPPHVNPNTHAVFELLPVDAAADNNDDDFYDYYDYGDDDRDEIFEEDLSPVSTLAIWSTGDDVSAGDDFGLLTGDNVRPKPTNQNNKVSYGNNGNKVGKKKPARRGGNRNRNRNKIGNNRHKVTKKRRRPSVNSNRNGVKGNRRPATAAAKKKKNKRQRQPNKRTPVRRKTNRNKSSSKKKKKKDKLQNEHSVSNKNLNRRTNANLAKRKKKRNNKDSINQGVRTYTKTLTYTETGGANDNRDVNCIIIRKDPPPTTPRPFWNILGRDAGNVQTSGQFGKRKRANLRFVA